MSKLSSAFIQNNSPYIKTRKGKDKSWIEMIPAGTQHTYVTKVGRAHWNSSGQQKQSA